jgi:stearoyl-CoA desaturase (delta-9 desaturase)
VENKTIYQDINKDRVAIDQRFTKNVPQWKVWVAVLLKILWITGYVLYFLYNCLVAMALSAHPPFLVAPIRGNHCWFGHICGYVSIK